MTRGHLPGRAPLGAPRGAIDFDTLVVLHGIHAWRQKAKWALWRKYTRLGRNIGASVAETAQRMRRN